MNVIKLLDSNNKPPPNPHIEYVRSWHKLPDGIIEKTPWAEIHYPSLEEADLQERMAKQLSESIVLIERRLDNPHEMLLANLCGISKSQLPPQIVEQN